mmetsp:Transcript_33968/g.73245  ORF Transcript_33968/g.73245 Transcript_33968/m.73245 type:complete len:226 (-) Transcript_33968:62-739(-)
MFWTFMLLAFFILVNIFLAILIDSYAEAKGETEGAAGIPEDMMQLWRKIRAGAVKGRGSEHPIPDPVFNALSYFQGRGIERVHESDIEWYLRFQVGLDPHTIQRQLAVMNGLPGKEDDPEIAVSLNELLLSAWATYDVDNSGYLDPTEFKAFIQDAPVKLKGADVSELMRRTDTNADGQISFEEFTPVFHAVMMESLKEAAKEKHDATEALRKQRVAEHPPNGLQ